MTASEAESDEDLMNRLKAGGDPALNRLIEHWELPLRRYLQRFLQNEADATEVAQEAFVRVYQNRARYAQGMRFSPWLFTIATNLARNRTRWRGRHPADSLDAAEPAIYGQTALQNERTPQTMLEANERALAVREAIAELPADLRTAVLLFEYEQMAQADIATVMACSEKAVETRLYRARKALRKSLSRFFSETPSA